MKRARAASDSLDNEPRIFIDEDRHSLGRLAFMNDKLVSVRIAKLRHPAYWCFKFFGFQAG
jgi:hypothetical protein